MFSTDEETGADITLADLWTKGVGELQYDAAADMSDFLVYEGGQRVGGYKAGSPEEAIEKHLEQAEEGVSESDLTAEEATWDGFVPTPKKSYEIAEGVVGEMPFPKLGIREDLQEINERLVSPLFKENVSAQELQDLEDGSDGSAIREGITTREFKNKTSRADVEQALRILKFDGEEPDPEDVNPEMAAVVVNHFTALRPGTTNGQPTS